MPRVSPGVIFHDVGINIALAVVFTVSVTVALVVVGESETEAGLNEQVAPDGNPEHVRLIVPVYPCTAVTVSVAVAELPAVTVIDGFDDEI